MAGRRGPPGRGHSVRLRSGSDWATIMRCNSAESVDPSEIEKLIVAQVGLLEELAPADEAQPGR